MPTPNAPLAQWLERPAFNRQVLGSSPRGHTNLILLECVGYTFLPVSESVPDKGFDSLGSASLMEHSTIG